MFPVRYATEAIILHLKNTSIVMTKRRQVTSKGKVVMELFFLLKWNYSHVIHPRSWNCKENAVQGDPWSLRDSIRRKRPELWLRKNWLLLDDKAPSHRSVVVQEELATQEITVLPHTPYQRDLAPCDFLAFPNKKALLCGRRFHSAEEVMTATRKAVRDLPADMIQRCFQ